MSAESVWITGTHAITPLGAGPDGLSAVFDGRTAIAPQKGLAKDGVRSTLAAQVGDFGAESAIDSMKLRRLDRVAAMAIVCARRAVADAALTPLSFDPDRAGIVLGTGFGGLQSAELFHASVVRQGPARANPMVFPLTVPNSPAGQVSIDLGFRGPNVTVTELASSAESAIAFAASLIQLGRADVVLAGGLDDLSPVLYSALDRLGVLSHGGAHPEGVRPFDRLRNGPVWGEGAGFVVLESEAHARRRGASRHARFVRAGWSGEACRPNEYPKSPDSIARALLEAVGDGAAPGLVLAAANGACGLDAVEARAIQRTLGMGPSVSSVAGSWGHWTSSGGAKAALLVESLRRGVAPPTLGLRDPEVDLRYTRSESSGFSGDSALLSAVSPGGGSVSLLFSR